jgi:transmembrane sensor
MSTHKGLPLSGQIVEEATTWFVEFNEGEVAQPDRKAFIEWLKTSPEHIRAYLQVTAHWEEARALSKVSAPSIDDLVTLAREPGNVNVIPIGTIRLAAEGELLGLMEGSAQEAPLAPRQTHRYVLAASIAIAIIGLSSLYWYKYQRGVYTTQIGEQRYIELRDGSTVELNARSTIRVSMHEHERDVELIEGQALFRVAKDHARPFIVHSGGTNVLAVGTQFDVYKHRSGTTVTVVEGRVAVFPSLQRTGGEAPDLTVQVPSEPAPGRAPQSSRHSSSVKSSSSGSGSPIASELPENAGDTPVKNEIFLTAGEQLTVSSESVQKAEHADVTAATAWMQKQIVFSSTPLSEVAEEFNRYNSRRLVITDSKIMDTRISGEFSSTNPDSLLKGLDAMKKFNIRETPGQIEISSK